MTQKEIGKFLTNTKIYVAGKSKEIQEKLFSLGYKWCDGSIEVCFTEAPFLFIYTDMTFAKSSNMVYFSNHKDKEISAEEILSLELTEPAYRPFRNKKECWNEMLKHQLFGYVKSKLDGSYNHIIKLSNSTTIGKTSDCIIEFKNDILCYHDVANLHDNYTFADGTPFGVKEN